MDNWWGGEGPVDEKRRVGCVDWKCALVCHERVLCSRTGTSQELQQHGLVVDGRQSEARSSSRESRVSN